MNRHTVDTPVAITGIGIICPLGTNTSECWNHFLQGRSGIRRITKFDPKNCDSRIGGQLPEAYFDLEKKKTSKRLFRQTVRATRIIRLCALEAIADSGVDIQSLATEKCAVIIGTSGSSVRSPDDIADEKTRRHTVIREMTNALPAVISLEFGFRGPSFTVSAACSSGSYAISMACDFIKSGVADLAVAGGVDYLLTENNVKRGNFLRVLSRRNDAPEKAMRPFDKRRDGWVMADGGCALILESRDHARARNAKIYAYIQGSGKTSESYSLYSPIPYGKGMERTIEMALEDSGVPKDRIGYVNANATATIINDLCETRAIKSVFGKRAYELLISSPKSMIGHTMGGAGAIEVATTALTLKTQKVPPTINCEYADPECDLNYVPNEMAQVDHLEAAISNTFGMGGHNSVIVLTKEPCIR